MNNYFKTKYKIKHFLCLITGVTSAININSTVFFKCYSRADGYYSLMEEAMGELIKLLPVSLLGTRFKNGIGLMTKYRLGVGYAAAGVLTGHKIGAIIRKPGTIGPFLSQYRVSVVVCYSTGMFDELISLTKEQKLLCFGILSSGAPCQINDYGLLINRTAFKHVFIFQSLVVRVLLWLRIDTI